MPLDETEPVRRARLVDINSAVEPHNPEGERKRLENQHGQIWDAVQLAEEFEVIGFSAPSVVVKWKADGRKGSLEFQHTPRFYFNLVLD